MLVIEIHNNGTGTNESANYVYTVLINDVVIAHGSIAGHDRRKGWRDLVGMLIDPTRRPNQWDAPTWSQDSEYE